MSLPYRNQKKAKTKSYILIGDGFDEYEVVYIIHKFRQAGLSIKSVSLFNKLVYSRQGVGLKADHALVDKPFQTLTTDILLILPSGGRNGEVLRQDARVHALLQAVNLCHGRVVVTGGGSRLADEVASLLPTQPSFLQFGEQGLEEFVELLTDQVVYAGEVGCMAG